MKGAFSKGPRTSGRAMWALAWWTAGVLALRLAVQASSAVSAAGGGGSSAASVVSRIVDGLTTGSRGTAAGIIRNSFSIDVIARTIAGKYWSGASAKQRREFVDALLHAT